MSGNVDVDVMLTGCMQGWSLMLWVGVGNVVSVIDVSVNGTKRVCMWTHRGRG